MRPAENIDIHIYGTGTAEGYKTVLCSPGAKPVAPEIERHCMRLGGERRVEQELATQPLTIAFLSDGRAMVSLWRPSPVPDSRNRPNPMEAVSGIFDFKYLQQTCFPLRQIRDYLGTISRQTTKLTQPNFEPENLSEPTQQDLVKVVQLSTSGEYSSGATYSANSARWVGLVPSEYRHFVAIIGFERFDAISDEQFPRQPLPPDFVEILCEYPYASQIKFVSTWAIFYRGILRQRLIRKRNKMIKTCLRVAFYVPCAILIILLLTVPDWPFQTRRKTTPIKASN